MQQAVKVCNECRYIAASYGESTLVPLKRDRKANVKNKDLLYAFEYKEGGMKKYLVIGLLIVSVLFAIPLTAAENVKIKLPDGLYMYNSEISKREDGREWVGFRTFFVVQNNIIYTSQAASKKFGVSKLNKLFTENKKYKILFGGEQIGEIYNVRIDNDEDWNYEEELLTKDIKEGPAYYWQEIMYPGKLTSATKCLAVPEEYKEVKKKFYTTIPQEEVDKVEKLAKEKLLPLLISRKGFAKYKIKEMELNKENLYLLDKISYRNDALYIGRYDYKFITAKTSPAREPSRASGRHNYKKLTAKTAYHFNIIFTATKDNVHIVTTNYEEGELVAAYMETYGMLDIDGDGEDELLIEKVAPREDDITLWLEMHKQKPDGKWTIIKTIKTRREL